MAARRAQDTKKRSQRGGHETPPQPSPERKRQAVKVRRRLARQIPDPRCELDHGSAWELTVATILSAQSTDKRVNLVTPELLRRWPTPQALARADELELQEVIHSTGFFRAKARNLLGAAAVVTETFDGQIPRTMEEMNTIPGVARKTGNVVLGTAYGIPAGITVDTHATRVSGRLGLTDETDPTRIERDLMALIPKKEWIDFGHRLVLHGRYTCLARGPRCGECACADVCPAVELPVSGSGVSSKKKKKKKKKKKTTTTTTKEKK